MDKSFLKYTKNQANIYKGYLNKGELNEIADEIASGIVKRVQMDFEAVHLTGNLAATTTASRVSPNEVKVSIPAVRYNLSAFKKLGVIEYQPEKGSYASTVNRTGGYSKTHTNYVTYSVIYGCVNALMNHGISEGAMKIKW